MRNVIITISCFLIGVVSFAQTPEFSGYYENQFSPTKIKGKFYLQDYNKLRLDLASEISRNITLDADIVYQTFHGKKNYNTFDFIPSRLVKNYLGEFPGETENIINQFAFENKDEGYLDNVFVTLYLGDFTFRVGKQQLPMGSGYSWNPTDIFNDKNLMDPTYEKRGINAFKGSYQFSSEGELTAVIQIKDNFSSSSKMLRIKNHLLGFDISLSYAEKEESILDIHSFSDNNQKRRLYGADFSGQIFGLGFWGEGAYNSRENGFDYTQALVGVDYTFENQIYLMTEYYYSGLGKKNYRNYTIEDWIRLLGTAGENLGQKYLSLGQRYPILELLDWSNFFLINLDDESGMLYPWFDYSYNDNTILTIVGYIPFGKRESEFGEFGAGGFARIKVYF